MRKLFSSLAITLFVLLGATGVAHATTYTSCGSVQSTETDADVNDTSGNCHITHGVNASGHLNIVSTGPITIDGDVTTGTGLTLQAPGTDDITIGGSLNVGTAATITGSHVMYVTGSTFTVGSDFHTDGALKANMTGAISIAGDLISVNQGHVILLSNSNIHAKSIALDNSTANYGEAGVVTIEANRGASSSTPFTIGSATSNGVTNTIGSSSSLGGGLGTDVHGGVYIQNFGDGGIDIVNGSKVVVTGVNSRAGLIYLDADQGPLKLDAFTLKADASPGFGAGVIAVRAKEVQTGSGAAMSASVGSGGQDGNQSVWIATDKLTINGSIFNINANGGRPAANIAVMLIPASGMTFSNDLNPVAGVSIAANFPNGVDGTQHQVQVTGGDLTIHADGNNGRAQFSGYPLTFTNGALTVSASGNANSGVFFTYTGTIVANQAALNFNGGAVNLGSNGNSSVTANNSGGTVEIFMDRLSTPTPHVTVTADGVGSGYGGNIYLFSGTNADVTLGTAAGQFSLSAKSGNTTAGGGGLIDVNPNPGNITINAGGEPAVSVQGTNGDGGHIQLIGTSVSLDTNGVTLNADGKGTGKGGQIEIYTATPINLNPAIISTKGGTTGAGGQVVAGFTAAFDVNRVINVDAGASTSQSIFDGSISLNGVQCEQYKTGFGSGWPPTYWNCVNPTSPVSSDEVPADYANTLPTALRTLLGTTHQTLVYVFPDITVWNQFWQLNEGTTAAGITIQNAATDPIYVSTMRSGNYRSSINSVGDTQQKEVTAHELGHAVDIATGIANDSHGATFLTYARRDFYDLDYVQSAAGPIRRDPCVAWVDPVTLAVTPAPFANAKDSQDGTSICTAGVVTKPERFLWFNSRILQTVDPGIMLPDTDPNTFATVGWSELHAQTFAWEKQVKTVSSTDYWIDTSNGVFANGFFRCTRAWSSNELGGSTSTAGCTTTGIPGSYEPGQ